MTLIQTTYSDGVAAALIPWYLQHYQYVAPGVLQYCGCFEWFLFVCYYMASASILCWQTNKVCVRHTGDARTDNPAFTFKLSFWQSLSSRLLNQRGWLWSPGLLSPLLSLQPWSWEGALNWKLLHIKPSACKPGSNWINILPSTINQMLSLCFSPSPLLFFRVAIGHCSTGTYLNFLVTN